MGTIDDERVLAALRGAHALVSDPSSWCRFATARDPVGAAASARGAAAVAWCGVGALQRVCGDNPRLFGMCLRHLEAANPFDADLPKVNDTDIMGRKTMCFIYEVAIERLARAVTRSYSPTGS